MLFCVSVVYFYCWVAFQYIDMSQFLKPIPLLIDVGLFPVLATQIKPLWTFVYKFLYQHVFPFFLGVYLVVELLGDMVTQFSKVAIQFFIPTSGGN